MSPLARAINTHGKIPMCLCAITGKTVFRSTAPTAFSREKFALHEDLGLHLLGRTFTCRTGRCANAGIPTGKFAARTSAAHSTPGFARAAYDQYGHADEFHGGAGRSHTLRP